MTEAFVGEMNDSDDLMWTIERDPILRSTITSVLLLDHAPDWDRLVRRMERVGAVIPRLHQRVKERPLRLARPDWVDTEFDLDYHLRRIVVPPPGTFEQVLDLSRVWAVQGFDLERPLWEFTLVEGLEGGQAAVVQKVHHTVTDGIGGVRLLLELFDPEPEPKVAELPAPPYEVQPGRSTFAAIRDQRGQRALTLAAAVPRLASRAARSSVRDPAGTLRRAFITLGSVGHMLAPVTEPSSPIMRGRGLNWQFDAFDIPLDAIRDAAKRAGGTVNDVFLAAVTQGLAYYHENHGTVCKQLYITLPLNIRVPEDPLGGNKFTPLRFKLPAAGPSGDERIRTMSRIVRSERDEPSVPLTPVLAAILDALPGPLVAGFFGGMLKNVDFVATNVPGIPFRCWFAGAEVLRQYAFAPPSGAAINAALLSHNGTACIGIVCDTIPVPDHKLVTACVHDAFDELLQPKRRVRKAAS